MNRHEIIQLFTLLSTIPLLLGCATFRPPQPWSLHPESANVYRYYADDKLALKESAILKVEKPLGIYVNDRYYRRVFSVPPGEHTVALSYLQYNDFGAPTESRRPIPVSFDAVAGRTYKAFYIEFFDLIGVAKRPNVWQPFILDITDDAAMDKILRESTYPTIREEVIGILSNREIINRVATNDPDDRVRNAASRRLSEITDSQ